MLPENPQLVALISYFNQIGSEAATRELTRFFLSVAPFFPLGEYAANKASNLDNKRLQLSRNSRAWAALLHIKQVVFFCNEEIVLVITTRDVESSVYIESAELIAWIRKSKIDNCLNNN